MRQVLFPAVALLVACSFPVDEFEVQTQSASDAGGDASASGSGSPTTTSSSSPDSGSTTKPDSGTCKCVEWDDKTPTKCKKWQPDHCDET